MSDNHYLAIEGVIGVGKTSLVRLLQPVFAAASLLEVFEENPFLSNFYADRARYAFQTQIFFLLSRYHQQREAVPAALAAGSLIADYTFAKDALFARLNLRGDELATYERVHQALAEKIPPPQLVVYLRADTDVLMRRIARRDRPYERAMERAYIAELCQAYDEFYLGREALGASRCLTIDTGDLDFVGRSADLNFVSGRIRAALGIGPYQPALPLAAP
jgi:deoxyguanosine kinase